MCLFLRDGISTAMKDGVDEYLAGLGHHYFKDDPTFWGPQEVHQCSLLSDLLNK